MFNDREHEVLVLHAGQRRVAHQLPRFFVHCACGLILCALTFAADAEISFGPIDYVNSDATRAVLALDHPLLDPNDAAAVAATTQRTFDEYTHNTLTAGPRIWSLAVAPKDNLFWYQLRAIESPLPDIMEDPRFSTISAAKKRRILEDMLREQDAEYAYDWSTNRTLDIRLYLGIAGLPDDTKLRNRWPDSNYAYSAGKGFKVVHRDSDKNSETIGIDLPIGDLSWCAEQPQFSMKVVDRRGHVIVDIPGRYFKGFSIKLNGR